MASIVAKKKANQLYYYVVHSARVDGKPRIVQQTYLGTAERVAELVQDRTAPIPIAASAIEFGPARISLAGRSKLRSVQRLGVHLASASLRSFHCPLPLAGRHSPHLPTGPKTEVADWYRRSILHHLWGFPPERFTSQAFWDCFDRILLADDQDPTNEADQLYQAQSQLLRVWKEKRSSVRRLVGLRHDQLLYLRSQYQ